MLATNGSSQRARWAVMWVYVKGNRHKLYRKDFKDDYASAEVLYLKAIKAEKPYATLACVNMGFPPPVELRPRSVKKRGRDKRTRKIRVVEVQVEPLKELNMKGELWCPYCRALRSFKLSKYAVVDGIRFLNARYICPICKISHQDHNVRFWNPTASIHMENVVSVKRRSSPRTPSRTRRVRT